MADTREYELGGSTYMLTEENAEALGAKQVRPRNKMITPDNKGTEPEPEPRNQRGQFVKTKKD